MQLFGEIFLYINDVLIFAKRSFSLEQIDRIYIGSSVGAFIGMDEYAKSYLGLESHEFNFSIAINSKEWYIDQIHILMVLSSQVYLEDRDETLNFSIFKRPPPLKNRPIGKLLGVAAASFILALAYPTYQFGYAQFLKFKSSKQTEKYNILFQENILIKQKIAKLKVEKEKISNLLRSENQRLDFRKKLIKEIHNKKVHYPMKAKLLVNVVNILNKYQSKISEANFENNQLILFIQNPEEKKITEFIKELTNLKLYKIATDKIEQKENSSLYFSKITIGLLS